MGTVEQVLSCSTGVLVAGKLLQVPLRLRLESANCKISGLQGTSATVRVHKLPQTSARVLLGHLQQRGTLPAEATRFTADAPEERGREIHEGSPPPGGGWALKAALPCSQMMLR